MRKSIIITSKDYLQKLLMKIQELNIAICKKGFLPALYYFFIWRPINRIGYTIQGFSIKIKI